MKKILFFFLITIVQFANCIQAQNSMVGDGFGGRLWYKPTNYAVGSYSGYSICYEGPCNSGKNQLYGWGNNKYSQLGYPYPTPKGVDTPTPIPGMADVKYYTCGYSMGVIKNDNSGWIFGRWWPAGPKKIIDDAYFVDASSDNISFVKTDGTVWSVGQNFTGAFGDGTKIASYDVPIQMKGITNAVRVANNTFVTIILLSDGTVMSVGRNEEGILGVGELVFEKLIPVPVPGLTNIVDIKATSEAVLALDNKGDLYAWGSNDISLVSEFYGILPDKTLPIPIKLPYKDIVAISGMDDGHRFLALDKDHNCFALNRGSYYDFSYFDVIDAEEKSFVIPDVIDILSGETFAYVVKSDGSLWGIGQSVDASGSSIWLDILDMDRKVLTKITPEHVIGACPVDIGAPRIAISPISPTICIGSTSTLSVFNDGVSTYTWSTGAHSPSITISPTSTTIYTITSNNGTCTATGSNTVYVAPTPTATINSPTICSGQTATLVVDGADTYTWSTGANTNTIIATPLSTTVYTVICKKLCEFVTTTTVNIIAAEISVTSPTICINKPTTLIADGAVTYTWSTGASSNSISVTPISKTIYTVEGIDSKGCKGIATATVEVSDPKISVNSSTICYGQSTNLNATGVNTYTWSTGDGSSSIVVSPTLTTTYVVDGTDLFGCKTSQTSTVEVNRPIADFSGLNKSIYTLSEGASLELLNQSTNATIFSWSLCNSSFSENRDAYLSLTDTGYCCIKLVARKESCIDSITKCFYVECDATILIPNVFTPNGDGVNDVFKIKTSCLKTLNCVIFDRWGLKLFEWDGIDGYWDGKASTGLAPSGTYFYIVRYSNLKGDEKTEKGFLTLFKD